MKIERVQGRALAVPGDDIDTDRIIPARFLKAVTFDGLEAHAFEDDRKEAAGKGRRHPFDDPAAKNAAVLLVNANFGCGSSREHAPQALWRRGIRAIVGESFAEIFFCNSLMMGLPCLTASRADVGRLMEIARTSPGVEFDVDHGRRVTAGVPCRRDAARRERRAGLGRDATGSLFKTTKRGAGRPLAVREGFDRGPSRTFQERPSRA
jgi:3-isopropylmalate/(R)-2-methylmalate dehydratase small subunit